MGFRLRFALNHFRGSLPGFCSEIPTRIYRRYCRVVSGGVSLASVGIPRFLLGVALGTTLGTTPADLPGISPRNATRSIPRISTRPPSRISKAVVPPGDISQKIVCDVGPRKSHRVF